LVHLRNMTVAAEAGALIMPAMPAFYHQPRSLRELTDHLVGKVLDSFGVPNDLYERWLSGA
jgi:4-hydroxy-3-polyprenylbenzoate decarboxylase